MKIAAVCITYGRPRYLEQLIRMFEMQTWPDRELVILDDAGQYPDNPRGDRWKVRSVKYRYPSLGQKRNVATGLISDDTDAIAVCDDDDTYNPWWLEACADALRNAHWARPSLVWDEWDMDGVRLFETFGHENPTRDVCYHGAWCYRVEAFHAAGRYPETKQGDLDTQLADELLRLYGPAADTISERFPVPYYIYHRTGDNETRKLAQDDAQRFERVAPPGIETLTPRWPDGYTRLLTGGQPERRPW